MDTDSTRNSDAPPPALGSLGAAAYTATLVGQARAPGPGCALDNINRERFHNAAVDALGEDALGPVLSGALFGDIPRALFAPIVYLIGAPPRRRSRRSFGARLREQLGVRS